MPAKGRKKTAARKTRRRAGYKLIKRAAKALFGKTLRGGAARAALHPIVGEAVVEVDCLLACGGIHDALRHCEA